MIIGPQARKAAYVVTANLLILVLLDLVLVLPVLRARGFYFESDRVESRVTEDSSPNNLLANNRRIWSYMPRTRYSMIHGKEGVSAEVQINAAGFRDEEPAERSGAGFSFVALGDSFTFGWLVSREQRWDEQLAGTLSRELGTRVVSRNLGMWMSTFDQHALVLEEEISDDDDLVIHLVYPSHLQTINRHTDTVEGDAILKAVDPYLSVQDGRLYYASDGVTVSKNLRFPFTFSLLRYLYALNALTRTADAASVLLEEEAIYDERRIEQLENGWRLTEMSIHQIARLTKQRGIPYLVVAVPRSFQLDLDGAREDVFPQQRFEEIVRATGWADYLDLLPEMPGPAASYYFRHDPHWNPRGHAIAARVIGQLVLREGLLDASRRRDARPSGIGARMGGP